MLKIVYDYQIINNSGKASKCSWADCIRFKNSHKDGQRVKILSKTAGNDVFFRGKRSNHERKEDPDPLDAPLDYCIILMIQNLQCLNENLQKIGNISLKNH